MLYHSHTCTHTIHAVLDSLRAHRGMAFTEEELCQQFDCTPIQIQIALHVLLHETLIQKERSIGGSDRFTWSGT